MNGPSFRLPEPEVDASLQGRANEWIGERDRLDAECRSLRNNAPTFDRNDKRIQVNDIYSLYSSDATEAY